MDCEKKNKILQILNYHGTRDIINYYVDDIRTLDLLKFLNEDRDFYKNIICDVDLQRKKNWDYEVSEYKNIFNCVKWFLEILLKVCKSYRGGEGKKYGELTKYLRDCYTKIFTKKNNYWSDYNTMFRAIFREGQETLILYKDMFKNNPEELDNYRFWSHYEYFIHRHNLETYCETLDYIFNKKKKNKKSLYRWLDKFIRDLERKYKNLMDNFKYLN